MNKRTKYGACALSPVFCSVQTQTSSELIRNKFTVISVSQQERVDFLMLLHHQPCYCPSLLKPCSANSGEGLCEWKRC